MSDPSKPSGVKESAWQRFSALKEQRKVINEARARREEQRAERKRKREEDISDTRESDTSNAVTMDDVKEPQPVPSVKRLTWDDVRPYMGQKDHLKGLDRGRCASKTALEGKVDEAVSLGDVDMAEKLSDHMAKRELGKRVADAFDAKKFAEERKQKEELKQQKKKKKLHWGFQMKEKWETKGNM